MSEFSIVGKVDLQTGAIAATSKGLDQVRRQLDQLQKQGDLFSQAFGSSFTAAIAKGIAKTMALKAVISNLSNAVTSVWDDFDGRNRQAMDAAKRRFAEMQAQWKKSNVTAGALSLYGLSSGAAQAMSRDLNDDQGPFGDEVRGAAMKYAKDLAKQGKTQDEMDKAMAAAVAALRRFGHLEGFAEHLDEAAMLAGKDGDLATTALGLTRATARMADGEGFLARIRAGAITMDGRGWLSGDGDDLDAINQRGGLLPKGLEAYAITPKGTGTIKTGGFGLNDFELSEVPAFEAPKELKPEIGDYLKKNWELLTAAALLTFREAISLAVRKFKKPELADGDQPRANPDADAETKAKAKAAADDAAKSLAADQAKAKKAAEESHRVRLQNMAEERIRAARLGRSLAPNGLAGGISALQGQRILSMGSLNSFSMGSGLAPVTIEHDLLRMQMHHSGEYRRWLDLSSMGKDLFRYDFRTGDPETLKDMREFFSPVNEFSKIAPADVVQVEAENYLKGLDSDAMKSRQAEAMQERVELIQEMRMLVQIMKEDIASRSKGPTE